MGGYALPTGGGDLPKGYVKQELCVVKGLGFKAFKCAGIQTFSGPSKGVEGYTGIKLQRIIGFPYQRLWMPIWEPV